MRLDQVIDASREQYVHSLSVKTQRLLDGAVGGHSTSEYVKNVAKNFKEEYKENGVQGIHRYAAGAEKLPPGFAWRVYTVEFYELVRANASDCGFELPELGITTGLNPATALYAAQYSRHKPGREWGLGED